MSTVVVYPCTMLCPLCSHALHRSSMILGDQPPPPWVRVKCLNSRCAEKGVVKRYPLTTIHTEVEVDHAEQEP
jgi:hypothetical protein